MFEINTNGMTDEQKRFVENIALFNSDKDYIMFCEDAETKDKILPLIKKERIEDIKTSKLITGIILVHKNILRHKSKPLALR